MICDALRRLDRAALVSAITTHVRYVEEQIIRNIRENEQFNVDLFCARQASLMIDENQFRKDDKSIRRKKYEHHA